MTIAHDLLNETHTPAPRLKSSWRHRRLVLGGHVLADPVALARPAMKPKELALLTAILARSEHMLEFGAGGSTTLALKLGVSNVVAVESDPAWIDRLKADEAAARAMRDGRLTVVHADIGPTVALGRPAEESSREKWPTYATAPWALVDLDGLDVVLIDGRFRLACIMQTVMRVSPETLIVIHDFWNRPAYHPALAYLDTVAQVDSLGVFTRKPDYNLTLAELVYARAAYEPS